MKYFTHSELTRSSTAFLHKIDNTPKDPKIYDNLEALVDNVLDQARELLGAQIIVSSGYRSPKVNKLVGGVSNSEHLTGCAADIYCKPQYMDKLWNILKHLPHDQLIMYKNKNFYHVSYREGNNRNQTLYM